MKKHVDISMWHVLTTRYLDENFAESLDYYLEQKDVEIKALVEEI